MSVYTSRERVIAAFERRIADHPATDLRCTEEAWTALKKHFNVETNNDVLDALNIDMRWLYLPYTGPAELSAATLFSEGTDYWGVKMVKAENKYNTYFEISHHPLANMKSIDEIESYSWPSLDWWDYSAVPRMIETFNKKEDRAIMFYAESVYETAWYMRGLENFLVDLYENPEIVDCICTRIANYYYERILRVIEAANGKIDIIGSGGDIGEQRCMLMSPAIWREKLKSYTMKLITPFKEMGFKTFYHSCGSLVPVIDDFIEAGLDVLDPIQVTAEGMNPEEIFPQFGDRLSFHGAIDVVELLPHSSAEEVYRETTRMIDILGRNGGFIVAPSHMVQGDTPIENVVVIYDAAKDHTVR